MSGPENNSGEQERDPRLEMLGLIGKYFKQYMSDQEIGSLKRNWEAFQSERMEMARKRAQGFLQAVEVTDLPGINPLTESDGDLLEVMWMHGEQGLTGTDLDNVIRWSGEAEAA